MTGPPASALVGTTSTYTTGMRAALLARRAAPPSGTPITTSPETSVRVGSTSSSGSSAAAAESRSYGMMSTAASLARRSIPDSRRRYDGYVVKGAATAMRAAPTLRPEVMR